MDFYFVHNNINVTDIDKSVEFYNKALGLKLERKIEEKDFYHSIFGRQPHFSQA